jgi:hypothetical protein
MMERNPRHRITVVGIKHHPWLTNLPSNLNRLLHNHKHGDDGHHHHDEKDDKHELDEDLVSHLSKKKERERKRERERERERGGGKREIETASSHLPFPIIPAELGFSEKLVRARAVSDKLSELHYLYLHVYKDLDRESDGSIIKQPSNVPEKRSSHANERLHPAVVAAAASAGHSRQGSGHVKTTAETHAEAPTAVISNGKQSHGKSKSKGHHGFLFNLAKRLFGGK